MYAGAANLFPWNILITVTGYWNFKLRNATDSSTGDGDDTEHLTELQVLYNSYLAIAYNVPNALFIIATAMVGYKFNTKVQIYGTQVVACVIFAAIAGLALVDTDAWQGVFLTVSLVLIALQTAFNGILQGKACRLPRAKEYSKVRPGGCQEQRNTRR